MVAMRELVFISTLNQRDTIMAITLDASLRTDTGRGASRRLRRQERIPGIVLEAGKETISISLDEKKLIVASLKDEFYKGLQLNLDGRQIGVKPVAFQRHPVTSRIIHVDFQVA